MRVAVDGAIAVSGEAQLRAALDAAAPAFLHVRERLDGLRVVLDANDTDGTFDSPQLAAVAAKLRSLAEGGSDDAVVASDALRLLARYDLTAGGRRAT